MMRGCSPWGESKYNKADSAGYKDLNIIFIFNWRRENMREKINRLSCKNQLQHVLLGTM
jgi:hypothetical protein